ncbi:MAG: NAD(P)H-quinone dehydrogenase [Actinomycetia bacterium]|nr:NAD(P)H-quinone dehydrogenase [Actinomycetes bacterium]
MSRIVIVGGGPGGYEAALVAAQHGASVTVIDRDGIGGSAVLTDCVPSKAMIAVTDVLGTVSDSSDLGITINNRPSADSHLGVDLGQVNARIRLMALAQSRDTRLRLERAGVHLLDGVGRLDGSGRVIATDPQSGRETAVSADTVLLATGARPRELSSAPVDGERILNWEQVYGLTETPEHLVVVGSGVTGAEFASAFRAMGSAVTLVSSRDQVLPGEDTDAAGVLEAAFARRGVSVLAKSRAKSVSRVGDQVIVELADGERIEATHCLMAVGSVPNTEGLGLETANVVTGPGGFIEVDGVSRTSAQTVYAAGDCTGVMMLASVAAMQGRIAMWHVLGQPVRPLELKQVSANIFTDPEIASVGYSQLEITSGAINAVGVTLPLRTNARAKMAGITDGFVKLFCRSGTRIVVGGVVVAPRASELIQSITLAVDQKLTVDQLAETFTVYPSLSGSIAEAARQLHQV